MRFFALLALCGLAVATFDEDVAKIKAALDAKMHHKPGQPSPPPHSTSTQPEEGVQNTPIEHSPNANELSRWVLKPDTAAKPTRSGDVDWSRVKAFQNVVNTLNLSSAGKPPDLAGLRSGASPAAPVPLRNSTSTDEVGKAYGSARAPFADSRFGSEVWNTAKSVGRLLFDIGTTTYACSATLIGKSLLLTAGHCVFKYGANSASGFYTNFRFYPQLSGGVAPYGSWSWRAAMVPSVYYAGTDTCTQRGVVCNNDIGLIWLEPTGSSIADQAGAALGYFPYSWNGYSFITPSSSFTNVFGTMPYVAITQLGYPVAYDGGKTMQMSNSPGYRYATTATLNRKQLLNIMRGTSMTGGSSGGPWIVNYGVQPSLSSSATQGSDAKSRNAISAVTSWGYTDETVKVQGASWFGQNAEYTQSAYGTRGAGNIGKLVYDACDNPVGWQLQSQGFCT